MRNKYEQLPSISNFWICICAAESKSTGTTPTKRVLRMHTNWGTDLSGDLKSATRQLNKKYIHLSKRRKHASAKHFLAARHSLA